jgi:hypothetical protein
MTDTNCPKCRHKVIAAEFCSSCGIHFRDYAEQKAGKLNEVSGLLGEGRYEEAREVAGRLPIEFPDSRNDFLLLLSNINRDISIVEKCRQARECCDRGEYARASFLLRNIKAFDKKLDEKVISLRRRVERHLRLSQQTSGEEKGADIEDMQQGAVTAARASEEAVPDTMSRPASFGGTEAADFIF